MEYRSTYDLNKSESGRLLVGLCESIGAVLVRCGFLGRRRRCRDDGGLALLGSGLRNDLVEWWLQDLDRVWEGLAGTNLALGIPALHAIGREY